MTTMSCKYVIIFFLFGLYFFALKTVKGFYKIEECETSEGERGGCVMLTECPHFRRSINEASTPEQREIIWSNLIKSQCPFDGAMSKFCCPGIIPTETSTTPYSTNKFSSTKSSDLASAPNSSSTTESAPYLSSPRKRFSYTTTSEYLEPKDVTGHPNLGLLPQNECGPFIPEMFYNLNFEFPWAAYVSVLFRFRTGGIVTTCRGSIINERYILTSASCLIIKGKTTPTLVKIRCRTFNYKVEECIPHELYEANSIIDDIALIRLQEKINFTDTGLSPICLPIDPKLQDLELELEATEFSMRQNSIHGEVGCEIFKPTNVDDTTRNVQFGVASFWPKNCQCKTGVYTRVSLYLDWILDNIKP